MLLITCKRLLGLIETPKTKLVLQRWVQFLMANHEILDLAGERARRQLFSNSFPFDPVNRCIMYELLTFCHKVEIPIPNIKNNFERRCGHFLRLRTSRMMPEMIVEC